MRRKSQTVDEGMLTTVDASFSFALMARTSTSC